MRSVWNTAKQSTSLLLVFAGVASLILANSPIKDLYARFWDFQFSTHSIRHWINEGAMTLFFYLIGIELKREFREGELASKKSASLPFFGALGGMIAPGLIYLSFNWDSPARSGWGIPMATDIVFALSALSLVGRSLPASLKVFLTALAVLDDLGSILLIAVFYSQQIYILPLLVAAALVVLTWMASRKGEIPLAGFALLGVSLWIVFSKAGVQPTLAGVITAFAQPVESEKTKWIETKLQPWVNLGVLPLFVLSQLNLTFDQSSPKSSTSSVFWGVLLGLVIGKPIGITLFSYLGIITNQATLPKQAGWLEFFSVTTLAGIGFTVSLFISQLAFTDPNLLTQAKLGILGASFLAVIVGFTLLRVRQISNS